MIPRPSCGKWRQIGIPYETCIDFWSLWSPPLGGGSFFITHLWWTTKKHHKTWMILMIHGLLPRKINMEPAKITLLKRRFEIRDSSSKPLDFFGCFHVSCNIGFIALQPFIWKMATVGNPVTRVDMCSWLSIGNPTAQWPSPPSSTVHQLPIFRKFFNATPWTALVVAWHQKKHQKTTSRWYLDR